MTYALISDTNNYTVEIFPTICLSFAVSRQLSIYMKLRHLSFSDNNDSVDCNKADNKCKKLTNLFLSNTNLYD